MEQGAPVRRALARLRVLVRGRVTQSWSPPKKGGYRLVRLPLTVGLLRDIGLVSLLTGAGEIRAPVPDLQERGQTAVYSG